MGPVNPNFNLATVHDSSHLASNGRQPPDPQELLVTSLLSPLQEKGQKLPYKAMISDGNCCIRLAWFHRISDQHHLGFVPRGNQFKIRLSTATRSHRFAAEHSLRFHDCGIPNPPLWPRVREGGTNSNTGAPELRWQRQWHGSVYRAYVWNISLSLSRTMGKRGIS